MKFFKISILIYFFKFFIKVAKNRYLSTNRWISYFLSQMKREIGKGGFWQSCECLSTIVNLGLAIYERLGVSK